MLLGMRGPKAEYCGNDIYRITIKGGIYASASTTRDEFFDYARKIVQRENYKGFEVIELNVYKNPSGDWHDADGRIRCND